MGSLGSSRRYSTSRDQGDLPFSAALGTAATCIMNTDGTILRDCSVATEPNAIAAVLDDDRSRLERIGLEAGPLSEWVSDSLGASASRWC